MQVELVLPCVSWTVTLAATAAYLYMVAFSLNGGPVAVITAIGCILLLVLALVCFTIGIYALPSENTKDTDNTDHMPYESITCDELQHAVEEL